MNWTLSSECGTAAPYRVAENCSIQAHFTDTTNTYPVSIVSSDTTYGTVDESSVNALYGTTLTVNDNVLTIGSNPGTAVTATPAQNPTGYTNRFVNWTFSQECGSSAPYTVAQ